MNATTTTTTIVAQFDTNGVTIWDADNGVTLAEVVALVADNDAAEALVESLGFAVIGDWESAGAVSEALVAA